MDSLFVTGGLAAAETMTGGKPDPDRLAAFTAAAMVTPALSSASDFSAARNS